MYKRAMHNESISFVVTFSPHFYLIFSEYLFAIYKKMHFHMSIGISLSFFSIIEIIMVIYRGFKF